MSQLVSEWTDELKELLELLYARRIPEGFNGRLCEGNAGPDIHLFPSIALQSLSSHLAQTGVNHELLLDIPLHHHGYNDHHHHDLGYFQQAQKLTEYLSVHFLSK